MLKILQICTSVNIGNTGCIAEDVGKVMMENGHESFIAYGRGNRRSKSQTIKIGNKIGIYLHVLFTLLFDRHGFASINATRNLVKKLKNLKPDVILLHNIHGYYLNIRILFNYLEKAGIPVVWTLHDCWSFTGHCTYFDSIGSEKWQIICKNCPKSRYYPASCGIDNSKMNFIDKQSLFNAVPDLTLIVPTGWLGKQVSQSFLKNKRLEIIHNGVDGDVFTAMNQLESFKNKHGILQKRILLGVASIWVKRKGLADFILLEKIIPKEYRIVLIGLSKNQIRDLPEGMIGIERTEDILDLARWYNTADYFINPTWQDNFPTTNLEALACGTPVITYATGGSPEAVDTATGIVVEKGNVAGIWEAILLLEKYNPETLKLHCRQRALKLFNKEDRYHDYLNFFEGMLLEKLNI